ELFPSLDGAFFGFQAEDSESANWSFSLSEWPINNRRFSSRHADAHSLRARQQPASGYHSTACCCILSQFCDGCHKFGIRRSACFKVLVRFNEHHELHLFVLLLSNSSLIHFHP